MISDGNQSAALIHGLVTQFESNVISDVLKHQGIPKELLLCLRVM